MSVRVRFAPSPTGAPHVGNIRTAIFNWLFARKEHGTFILRVEDTDRQRYEEEALKNIMESLRWLGLDWDEGPEVGGDSGPYFQSQRLELYHKYARELIELGWAYYCTCSEERLESVRAQQKEAGVDIRYDRKCRDKGLTGDPSDPDKVIRFKMPLADTTSFVDTLHGRVEFQTDTLDDFVLIKSDGWPTYHFANIIDDHLMKITHVMRAEEWIPSTGKHILMYHAFGFDPPEFVHLPMILGEDKSKLSKRHGAVSLLEYRERGYLSEALFNYLSLLGWSPKNDQEIIAREELVESFGFKGISKSAGVFDPEKLKWMNRWYLQNKELDYIKEQGRPFLEAAGFDISDENDEKYSKFIAFARNRVSELSELPAEAAPFFEDVKFDVEHTEWLMKDKSKQIFTLWREELPKKDSWGEEELSELMKRTMETVEVKGKEFYFPIRLALYGSPHGPQISDILDILSREKVLKRLDKAINFEGGE